MLQFLFCNFLLTHVYFVVIIMQALKHSIPARTKPNSLNLIKNTPIPPTETLDYKKLEHIIEIIASKGCLTVNKLLSTLKKEQIPKQLHGYSLAECDFIYHELEAVMAVYGN